MTVGNRSHAASVWCRQFSLNGSPPRKCGVAGRLRTPNYAREVERTAKLVRPANGSQRPQADTGAGAWAPCPGASRVERAIRWSSAAACYFVGALVRAKQTYEAVKAADMASCMDQL